jgi:hypothetical protein
MIIALVVVIMITAPSVYGLADLKTGERWVMAGDCLT